MSCFTTILFFLQATTLSKLEAEEKARKALEEDNKRQVESTWAELAQLRGAAGTGSREAVLKVLTESEQRVKADMAETKRFSNHTHDYIKTKMTTTDFRLRSGFDRWLGNSASVPGRIRPAQEAEGVGDDSMRTMAFKTDTIYTSVAVTYNNGSKSQYVSRVSGGWRARNTWGVWLVVGC